MRRSANAALVAAMTIASIAVSLPAAAASIRCHGEKATIVGTDHNDTLPGTAGPDVIAALGGDDIVDGRGGNDLICGGAGADHLSGGAGTDRIYGGLDRVLLTDEGITERTGDTLDGGLGSDKLVPGQDTRPAEDVFRDTVSWETSRTPLHMNLATGIVTGNGHDRVVGGPIAVTGSPFNDVVDGSDHADQIYSAGGSDIIHARAGDDIVNADGRTRDKPGADRVRGGKGDDQLSADHGDDVLRGGSGHDVLDDFGNTADALYGGAGPDLIVTELVLATKRQVVAGGPGKDSVGLLTNDLNPSAQPATGTWNMATGRLTLTLDRTVNATVIGFEDSDLSTYGTTWSVRGTKLDDTLTAVGTNGTTFTALAGDDTFWGSNSDDTFLGGPGEDHSLGMAGGNDTCVSVEILDFPDCENVTS
jgi:Ca2+-binding RTX toxin-like protein